MNMKTMSKYQKLHPLEHDAVSWQDGFWGRLHQLCRMTVLPSMRAALDEPENGAVFSNFYIAAGLAEGQRKGTMWSDGDCYKYMEAVTHIYGATGEQAAIDELDELIAVIAAAQEDDGYISTPMQLRADKARWTNLHDHELYNMGHLLTAASVHHRITGKRNFLQIAIKLADYLHGVFVPCPPELAHFGFNPSNIMGAVDLYRVTGNEKYLDLARAFVDMRGSQPGGKDLNQSLVPLREETRAVGHAVTAGYLYCGATDVYAETGDAELLAALDRVWDNAARSKTYITGGTSAQHHGASQRPEFGGSAGAVHEAFGYEYQLPNATAYNETCANIAHAMWNWRLLNLTGDAKYADVMERVLYNSMLSSMTLDGIKFCYTNPLRWYGAQHALLSQDRYERRYLLSCYCCPPNTARTIALLHNWVYSQSDDALWVHLYSSSSLDTTLADGSAFALRQSSDYPWDDRVTITIDQAPAREIGLMLRIPGWAGNAALDINGEAHDGALRPQTYVEIKRVWKAGDSISLRLPMAPRLVKAHPKAEEIRNHVAVMRGPLVYCLEGVDLPDDVSILDVHAPNDMGLEARREDDLLGGLTVVKGTARRVLEGNPSEALYFEAGNEREEDLDVTLIPYYAWNNRGITEMTVWLPRSY
ncbi:MAG: glycoside hydrolase family 127 protein [Chloroflexota bacterium]|nr:glycoside hydrolase family 127 protein [Chloroflexota bacterium]